MLAHPDHSRIMLDSPAKTRSEIRTALEARVGLTIDNLDELSRVDQILSTFTPFPPDLGLIGIRINPQIGGGAILTHSVSKLWSKFGTPIGEKREEVISAYLSRPWLNMMHVHAGSQTYSLNQLADAIRVVMDLVIEINTKSQTQQIKTIDIGGGLPVNFGDEANVITFQEWSDILRNRVPELFTGDYNVITEYGRRFLAKQGVMVSRVEYVKEAGGRRVILQHAGADVAVRTVYRPEAWPLRVTCFGIDGGEMLPGDVAKSHTSTTKPLLPADIAGPCCIDDVLNPSQRPLPDVEEGDYVMMHDTGAYYHSAYSYYNCRQAPSLFCFKEPESWMHKVEGVESKTEKLDSMQYTVGDAAPIQFELIRKAATVNETIEFFTTQKQ